MTAALGASLPPSRSTAQAPQPLSKQDVVALVDSMAGAYMAERRPASMPVARSIP